MSEAQILKGVLELCRRHPKVKRAWRQNTGLTKMKGFYVRFGEVGHSDVMGFLKDSRFFAIECKLPGQGPSEPQEEFLSDVKACGGVSGVATSIEDAQAILEAA